MYGSADDQDYIAGTLLAIRNELLAVCMYRSFFPPASRLVRRLCECADPQPPPVVRNYWLMTVPEGVVQDDAFAMIAAASVGDAATLTRLLDGPDGARLCRCCVDVCILRALFRFPPIAFCFGGCSLNLVFRVNRPVLT